MYYIYPALLTWAIQIHGNKYKTWNWAEEQSDWDSSRKPFYRILFLNICTEYQIFFSLEPRKYRMYSK